MLRLTLLVKDVDLEVALIVWECVELGVRVAVLEDEVTIGVIELNEGLALVLLLLGVEGFKELLPVFLLMHMRERDLQLVPERLFSCGEFLMGCLDRFSNLVNGLLIERVHGFRPLLHQCAVALIL